MFCMSHQTSVQFSWLTVLGLFLAMGLCAECVAADGEPSFEKEVKSICKYIVQENPTQAKTVLDQFWDVHSTDKGFVDSMRRVKDQYWANKNYQAHFDLCERIVKSFPKDPLSIGIQVDEVTGYIKLKDRAKASEKLAEFWDRYSSDDRFIDYARRIKDQYWTEGYYDEHFELCEWLITAFPEDPLSLGLWADEVTGYVWLKDTAKAAEKLEAFWDKHNKDEEFVKHARTVEDVYWRAGRQTEHFALCDRLIEAFPNDPFIIGVWADEITSYIRLKDTAKAAEKVEGFWANFASKEDVIEHAKSIKDAFWQAGQYDEHFALCGRLVEAFPNNPKTMDVRRDIVTGYIKRNEMSKAAENLEAFWENYSSEKGFIEEAKSIKDIYWQTGKYNEHFELCNRIVDTYPDDPNTMDVRRDIVTGYIKRKNFVLAEEELASFMVRYAEEPMLVQKIHEFGQEYAKAGNTERALELYYYNAENFHNTEYGLLSQGQVVINHIQNKDFDAAKKEYDQMLVSFDQELMLPREIYSIARVYANNGELDKAIELHRYNGQKFGKKDYGRWSRVEESLTLIRKKDFSEAKNVCESFAAEYADLPVDTSKELYLFGREFTKAGEPEMAFQQHLYNAQHFGDTNQGRWSNVEVIFYYIDTKNYEKEIPACMDFIDRYAEHPELGKEIRNILNRHAANGSLDKAKKLCELALKSYSANEKMIWMQGGLVQAYLDQMADDEADKAFEILLSDYKDNAELLDTIKYLGQYCREKYGDPGKASQFYSQFLACCPDHPRAIDIEVERVIAYLDMGAPGTQVETLLQGLQERYKEHADYLNSIKRLARVFRDYKQYAMSIGMYQQVLEYDLTTAEELEAYAEMAKARVHLDGTVIDPDSPAADCPDAESLVEYIMSQYEDEQRLGFHVYQIGEEYYFRAKAYCKAGAVDKAVPYSVKAFKIFEKNINDIPDFHHKCLSYYTMGLSYYYMRDYESAADALQKAYQTDPKFKYADYCLYENVRCYRRLANAGKVTRCEAFYNSVLFHDELLEQFPKSKYSSKVSKWLKRCMEE